MLEQIYARLPVSIRRATESALPLRTMVVRDRFINVFFDNRHQFRTFSNEFDNLVADTVHSKSMEEFHEMVPEGETTFGGIEICQARLLYAIVRSIKPDIVVETGVCNGVSTFVVLLAMEENQAGELYSVDYPTFSDDPAPVFQRDYYPDNHIFSSIPKNKQPGWIIPDYLTNRWELRTGKSQRELPPLLNELNEINMFIHDSDHTFPCMMFEYELAWEYLKPGSVLLSDDVHSNRAFDVFGSIRANRYGEACSGFGYATKSI